MTGWGTMTEVALYVGRPLRTVRNWAARGQIPAACRASDGMLIVHAASARQLSESKTTRPRRLAA